MWDSISNLFTAKEARESSDAYIKEQDRIELENIYNQICSQIILGKYEATIYKCISEKNKKVLKDLGFEIYEGPSYCCTSSYETHDEVITTISWRNG